MKGRFQFESALPGGKGSQHTCPNPNHKGNPRKEFTRFVDTYTRELLPDHVGRCNNTGDSCGYFYHWSQFLRDNPDYLKDSAYTRNDSRRQSTPVEKPKPVSYFPESPMQRSLQRPDENNLIKYLHTFLPAAIVPRLIDRYKIGTSRKPWPGSPIFWQIDQAGNVRSGKIIPYNPETGKRGKSVNWAHTYLKKSGIVDTFDLRQCLYGAHLTRDAEVIAVAEGEKTAIIASVYYPEYTWVATGGRDGLTAEKFRGLESKRIILFPDKGCYQDWRKKGQEIEKALNISGLEVSRLTENLPVHDGGDLADWLPSNALIPAIKSTTEPLPW